jgi:AcrR family transcriptional regulator
MRTSGMRPRRQAVETRHRILEAAASIVREFSRWDWRELTFRAVAERAGVSERTVYRYFGSEQELRDGVMGHLEEAAGVRYEGIELDDVPEVATRVLRSLASFSVQGTGTGAGAGDGADPTFVAEDEHRRAAVAAAVARSAPEWTGRQRTMAAGLLDVLWSVPSFARLSEVWHLDTEEAAEALGWLIRLLNDAIREDCPPGA